MKKYTKFIAIFVCLLMGGSVISAKKEFNRPTYPFIDIAIEYISEGDYYKAGEYLDKQLKEDPKNGYVFLVRGLMDFQNDELGDALKNFDMASKYIPSKDKEYQSMITGHKGKIYETLGDSIKALQFYNEGVKLTPDDVDPYERRADYYYRTKNYPMAEKDYREIIRIDPSNTLGYAGLGRNYIEEKRYNEAVDKFDYVIKLSPSFSQAYAFRGEALTGAGEYRKAARDFIKAMDIDQNEKAASLILAFPPEGKEDIINELKLKKASDQQNMIWPFLISRIYYNNKNYKETLDYLDIIEKIDNSPYVQSVKAEVYEAMDEHDNALIYINRALNMDPDDPELLNSKASILGHLGQFDEAIAIFNDFLENNPGDIMSYLQRANFYLQMGEYNKSVNDLETVFGLYPSLLETPSLLFLAGDAYRLNGNKEKADEYYNTILSIQENLDSISPEESKDADYETDDFRPMSYSGLGQVDKAIELQQKIIENEKDPENIPGHLYNLTCIYARGGRIENAIDAFRRAVDAGYKNYYHAQLDYDTKPLHDNPEFIKIIDEMRSRNSVVEVTEDEALLPVDTLSLDLPVMLTEKVEVPFSREDGVTKVKCDINGLPLYFVFDTGAADVTLSLVEANFMLKNNYIKPTDFIGKARYMDANGDISEGAVVNLKKVNFGGLELENVRASVVRNQRAPLLLGQSVLGRLGKIEINNPEEKLIITHIIEK